MGGRQSFAGGERQAAGVGDSICRGEVTMAAFDFEGRWRQLSEEGIIGMGEWRLQHPRATFTEIEAALDERLSGLRARMLQDAALASATMDWATTPAKEAPVCPRCQRPLLRRGQQKRRVQTAGGREVELTRTYGVCPACGSGFFPPG